MSSKIEWLMDKDGKRGMTWNPITGCSKISDGCKNCYAERMVKRLAGRFGYPKDDPFRPGTFHPDRIDINLFAPGKRVFVSSMGDLFHEAVNIRGNDLRDVFRCISHHENTFMLLTKRPHRMRDAIRYFYGDDFAEQMPHVWVGCTAENQRCADERIPVLLEIPAAVRWVSVEPMLGPVNLKLHHYAISGAAHSVRRVFIRWVIIGAESGPNRRPCKLEWVRDLVEQCKEAGVPVFVKQLDIGGKVEHDINKFPKDLQIRENPR